MSSSPANRLASKPLPKARPAAPGIAVATNPDDEVEPELRSPWELTGWAWSLVAHAVLLLILALWYFAPPPTKVPTFDTRIAGTEHGVEDGIESLGGLDSPTAMPELTPMAEASVTKLPMPELAANPLAGFAGQTGNPGAGTGEGFGLAKFGNGGENIRGVPVKVGDPQFTLLWDTKADIDLHVVEPGGKEIFWNDPKGRQGGELDVDNTLGFGPENIYWLKEAADGSKDLGPGPPGEYKWWVHYYGGNGGVAVPTRWKVRVKHEGRVEIFQGRLTVQGAKSKIYLLKVGTQ